MLMLRARRRPHCVAVTPKHDCTMYNRVKGPLFEHWKRAFSFALYKQTVECIHHGVTNAKTRQQQGNGPNGYDCDLHYPP